MTALKSLEKVDRIEGIFDCFLIDGWSFSTGTENFDVLEAIASGWLAPSFSINRIRDKTSYLDKYQEVWISLSIMDNPINCASLDPDVVQNFLKELQEAQESITSRVKVSLSLTITKRFQSNGKLVIHKLDWFSEYLSKIENVELLKGFSQRLRERPISLFLCQFDSLQIAGKGISIGFQEGPPLSVHATNRQQLILSAYDFCHFSNSAEIELLPSDFELEWGEIPAELSPMKSAFMNLQEILILTRLLDFSRIEAKNLIYKVGGYKARTGVHKVGESNFAPSIKHYLSICNWVYDGGSTLDKIGLARNFIGLHFKLDSSLELEGDPYLAIQSGYQIYQKQNVKQYLEVRNKVIDQLTDILTKSSRVSESFVGNFQKSTFSFLSFFASVLLVRLLGKGAEGPIFSTTTSVLTQVFLLLSLLYLALATWEFKRELSRLQASYTTMKQRFLDLLTKEDLEKILSSNTEFQEAKSYAEEKGKWYRGFWLAMLLAFTVATGLLSWFRL